MCCSISCYERRSVHLVSPALSLHSALEYSPSPNWSAGSLDDKVLPAAAWSATKSCPVCRWQGCLQFADRDESVGLIIWFSRDVTELVNTALGNDAEDAWLIVFGGWRSSLDTNRTSEPASMVRGARNEIMDVGGGGLRVAQRERLSCKLVSWRSTENVECLQMLQVTSGDYHGGVPTWHLTQLN